MSGTLEDDSKPPPGSLPGHDERARERSKISLGRAEEALRVANEAASDIRALREDVGEIKVMLGRAPSPGHAGEGLIGAVSKLEALVEQLVRAEEKRARGPAPRRVPRWTVVGLIAALGGGSGLTTLVHAVRGSSAPQVQTSGGKP